MGIHLFAPTKGSAVSLSLAQIEELEQEIAEAEAFARQIKDPKSSADLWAYAECLRKQLPIVL